MATNGIDPQDDSPEGWTEDSANHSPGDRRMIAASGAFTFAPGDTQYLDYAVVFARESQDPNLTVRETLNAYADEIVGMECSNAEDVVLGMRKSPDQSANFTVFPNPGSGEISLRAETFVSAPYAIFDLTGREVLRGRLSGYQSNIEVGTLRAGVYLIQIVGLGTRKVVIQ